MGKICVEIQLDTDSGQFSVAECPPGEAMEGQTFASAEEAMAAAAQMLQAGAQGGGQTTGDLKAAMQGGYDSVRPPQAPPQAPGAGMFGE